MRALEALPHRLVGERVIEAPTEAVWNVLSDFHGVDRWAPRVTRVIALGEVKRGLGAARHCDLRGLGGIDEVVNVWEEGRRLGYEVTALGPIRRSQSLWELAPVAGHTRVRLQLGYEMRFGTLGRWLEPVAVRPLLGRNLPGALALLRRHVLAAA